MIRTIAGLAGTAAVAVLALSGPAQAAWTGPSPTARPAGTRPAGTGHADSGSVGSGSVGSGSAVESDLKLTYMADSGSATVVTLTCDPNGGGYPNPAQACDTLTGIGADPGKMAPAHTMCMMIYAPVTAEITGTWRGEPVSWTHKFGNSCEMTRATGTLFEF